MCAALICGDQPLGHNEPSVPMENLYHLCCHVLQLVSLQKTAIYDALLKVTTQCVSPSREQRYYLHLKTAFQVGTVMVEWSVYLASSRYRELSLMFWNHAYLPKSCLIMTDHSLSACSSIKPSKLILCYLGIARTSCELNHHNTD